MFLESLGVEMKLLCLMLRRHLEKITVRNPPVRCKGSLIPNLNHLLRVRTEIIGNIMGIVNEFCSSTTFPGERTKGLEGEIEPSSNR